MLKLALGMMTVALMLSGCTAIQNTVGGGAQVPPDQGTGNPPSDQTDLSTIYQYKSTPVIVSLNRCYYKTDLQCDFTIKNIYGADVYVSIDSNYYWDVVLNDGKKYGASNFIIDEKTYSRTNVNIVDGFSKKITVVFNTPSKVQKLPFFDGHFNGYATNDNYFRFKDVPVY